ncbi:MAG: stage III sporulation protein AE [Clostridia bacterium]|nr:stage III sporulation protein AE [Clostridia bacterium]
MRAHRAAGRGDAGVHHAYADGGGRAALRVVLALLALAAALCCLPAGAAAEDAGGAADMREALDEVVSGLDFSGLEDVELTLPGWPRTLGVEEAVRAIASGEALSAEDMVASALGLFFDALSGLGALMLSLMLPVLLASLLSHTLVAEGDSLGSLVRSVCFVLILIPIVLLVIGELEHARETIVAMTTRMEKMLPMLLALLTAVGGNASSAFLHPVVVAASGSMVFLAREVILRLVMCTCAVTAVNHLSDRAHLTRMAQLLRSAVCWLLGVSFTVFLGAMSLQGVCSASIDGVAIRAAKYAVDNFVPVVGGMFSDTMDTLVGCTLIVKNALGVAAVLVLGAVILGPMIRTLAVVFVMKLSAALLEPVADAEVIGAIGDFSRTIVLFLITMLCVGTMYFLLIVQMLLVGNLTVMLR